MLTKSRRKLLKLFEFVKKEQSGQAQPSFPLNRKALAKLVYPGESFDLSSELNLLKESYILPALYGKWSKHKFPCCNLAKNFR